MKKVKIEIRVGAHRGKRVYAHKVRPYEESDVMYKVTIKNETVWLNVSEVTELTNEWKYKK